MSKLQGEHATDLAVIVKQGGLALTPDLETRVIAAGALDLASMFVTGTVTPREAIDVYLRRIDGLNPRINAFLTIDADAARAAAAVSSARWTAGSPLSPLDGVPFGVKANIAVAGLPWHAGISAYRQRRAERDADCVSALRKAGAVILGTLNMHEGALGATTDNPEFGRCHNPYRQNFTPGGSSGGSAAAVAAGLCAVSLGTDTMGSVRIPAAYCGCVGHLPRRGRISSSGVIPLSWTLDSIGVLARSAEDANAALQVLARGRNRAPSRLSSTTTVRCAAVDLSGYTEVTEDVSQAFLSMTERATAAGVTISQIELAGYDVAGMRNLALLIAEVEGFCEHEAALTADPAGFSSDFTAMLEWGRRQSAPRLAKAYRRLELTAERLEAELRTVDALLTPTTGTPAFAFSSRPPLGQADFTLLANILGWASTAFPVGVSREGLPLSSQIISRTEGLSLDLAARLTTPATPPPCLIT